MAKLCSLILVVQPAWQDGRPTRDTKTARSARQAAQWDRTNNAKSQWAKEDEIDDEYANAASNNDLDAKAQNKSTQPTGVPKQTARSQKAEPRGEGQQAERLTRDAHMGGRQHQPERPRSRARTKEAGTDEPECRISRCITILGERAKRQGTSGQVRPQDSGSDKRNAQDFRGEKMRQESSSGK